MANLVINPSETTKLVTYEAIEVKVDIDLKLSECEDQSSKFGSGLRIVPLNIMQSSGKKIQGDMYFYKNFLGVHLYGIRTFHMTYSFKCSPKGGASAIIELQDTAKNRLVESFDSSMITSEVNKDIPENTIYSTIEIDLGCSLVKRNIIGTSTIKGDFTLFIELIQDDPILENKQTIRSVLLDQSISYLKNQSDFTVICQDEKFKFNKILLCSLSEVFQKMIMGPNNKEAITDTVDIEDSKPETIAAFHRIVFGDDKIKVEDFTTDLLMFAQKYLMKPLVEECKNQLVAKLAIDNAFDLIKVAYFNDDDDLLKTTSKFLSKNLGQLRESEEWQAFQKSHPACMAKILNFMMFEK